jgi:microsomal dipeptidase-like Zn-dependent dipeptidase
VGDLPNITLELLRRGYNDDEVRMILGGNVLRVPAAAERAKCSGTRGTS